MAYLQQQTPQVDLNVDDVVSNRNGNIISFIPNGTGDQEASLFSDNNAQITQIMPTNALLGEISQQDHFVQVSGETNALGIHAPHLEPVVVQNTHTVGSNPLSFELTNALSNMHIVNAEGLHQVGTISLIQQNDVPAANFLQDAQKVIVNDTNLPVNVLGTNDQNNIYVLTTLPVDGKIQEKVVENEVETFTEPQRTSTPDITLPDDNGMNETILAGNVNLQKNTTGEDVQELAAAEEKVIPMEMLEKEFNVEEKGNEEKNGSKEMSLKKKIEPVTKEIQDKKEATSCLPSKKLIQIGESKKNAETHEHAEEKSHNQTYCRNWIAQLQEQPAVTHEIAQSDVELNVTSTSSTLLDITSISRNLPKSKANKNSMQSCLRKGTKPVAQSSSTSNM